MQIFNSAEYQYIKFAKAHRGLFDLFYFKTVIVNSDIALFIVVADPRNKVPNQHESILLYNAEYTDVVD